MRRWLQRFAGLRPWRRRRPDLDLLARCEVLRLRGELSDLQVLDPCGGSAARRAQAAVAMQAALRAQLPGIATARLALVSEAGDRVPVNLQP